MRTLSMFEVDTASVAEPRLTIGVQPPSEGVLAASPTGTGAPMPDLVTGCRRSPEGSNPRPLDDDQVLDVDEPERLGVTTARVVVTARAIVWGLRRGV